MPAELIALINKPVLLIAILFVGALIGIQVERFVSRQRRAEWRRRRGGKVLPFQQTQDRVPDAADQLRTVMKAEFKAQPLLNRSEARLFKAMDKMVIELAPPGWQVMAQVSLGEILRCEDKAAYRLHQLQACRPADRRRRLQAAARDRVPGRRAFQGRPRHRRARRGQEGSAAAGGHWLCRGGGGRHAGRAAAGGGAVGG